MEKKKALKQEGITGTGQRIFHSQSIYNGDWGSN